MDNCKVITKYEPDKRNILFWLSIFILACLFFTWDLFNRTLLSGDESRISVQIFLIFILLIFTALCIVAIFPSQKGMLFILEEGVVIYSVWGKKIFFDWDSIIEFQLLDIGFVSRIDIICKRDSKPFSKMLTGYLYKDNSHAELIKKLNDFKEGNRV